MKYESISDLPDTVRDVFPEGAQKVYLEVYNKAWERHSSDGDDNMSRHSVAHRQAWSAIEREYEQDGVTHQWYRKGEIPPSQQKGEKEDKGFLGRLREMI